MKGTPKWTRGSILEQISEMEMTKDKERPTNVIVQADMALRSRMKEYIERKKRKGEQVTPAEKKEKTKTIQGQLQNFYSSLQSLHRYKDALEDEYKKRQEAVRSSGSAEDANEKAEILEDILAYPLSEEEDDDDNDDGVVVFGNKQEEGTENQDDTLVES